ncbi:MAG TPA: RluA family pseudouridine synthase [Candidatus Kapabacteria bacterium]|jgi:23S rRNA pseudouridine1911/1915/1917 synthase|nr:RluA family pseudouridine synthase [Candidatus Kapabacteria bacterium]
MPSPDELSDDSELAELTEADQPNQRIIEIAIPKGERPERADQYLARSIAHSSRTKVQEAIVAGAVQVNGKVLDRPSYKIRGGDVFRITVPGSRRMRAEAENIPLDIVFEDEALLVLNKPAGMVVHPAHGHSSGTLVNALLHHIEEFRSQFPGAEGGSDRPGIVHRLDKDTSGLMVVAKTEEAHRNLARQFFHHTAHRTYNSIVWGNLKQRFGRIETLLGRHPKDRKKIAVLAPPSYEGEGKGVVAPGKLAITDYVVLEEFLGFSFVELRLQTGRTHQIRVHLQHIGHPVFGDAVYGGRAMNVVRHDVPHFKQWVENMLSTIARQALHARALRLHHPTTNELMEWSVPLPEDMQSVLLAMSNRTMQLMGE